MFNNIITILVSKILEYKEPNTPVPSRYFTGEEISEMANDLFPDSKPMAGKELEYLDECMCLNTPKERTIDNNEIEIIDAYYKEARSYYPSKKKFKL